MEGERCKRIVKGSVQDCNEGIYSYHKLAVKVVSYMYGIMTLVLL
jgi:spore maturation protein SpmA